jgi:hypothetical protein
MSDLWHTRLIRTVDAASVGSSLGGALLVRPYGLLIGPSPPSFGTSSAASTVLIQLEMPI